MTKQDLCKAAVFSSAIIAKIGRDETVTTKVLARICHALKCDILDICTISDNRGVHNV